MGRKVLLCFWALAAGNAASTGYNCVLKHHLHSLCFNLNPYFYSSPSASCFCSTDGVANNASLVQNSRRPKSKGILPV